MRSQIKLQLTQWIANRTIVILGFGREGRSTYQFLRSHFSTMPLAIADQNMAIGLETDILADNNLTLILGDDFWTDLVKFQLVFKTPGISFKDYKVGNHQEISSQTDLFLKLFGHQTIGITGTKGKSTTASLMHHVLSEQLHNSLLIGNIGVPALEVADKIDSNTWVVFELSSHQLEFVSHSPHIAILLNLYQEHLDHYISYADYRSAKWNITKYQQPTDFLIYNSDEKMILQDMENLLIKAQILAFGVEEKSDMNYDSNGQSIGFKNSKVTYSTAGFPLLGVHNYLNLTAVLLACQSVGLPIVNAMNSASTFKTLPHRMEFMGEIQGVQFYNDSIATIPQATIKALQSLPLVQTLILGGHDRGIDYAILIDFLMDYKPLTLLLVGKVGLRINAQLLERNYKGKILVLNSFDEVVSQAMRHTPSGNACLLSPAASSYDSFKNFEERGQRFKDLIEQFKPA